ncbi:hypothetical protein AWJ20_4623 [Sugiyamaella lignohabitans]|uniref:Uncharacterized protein n=1 Tax=Sugiyamaella lignohabitans TaxID=796027 RepID=A0A167E5V2_9ASCO|nr:uncharacterized protein AWJ20_4623 [Sugiyamaella lignohabitans]ANB13680.1 hypothetical protein AWJ20_4623 [Sugiyamaella lignohabitans]
MQASRSYVIQASLDKLQDIDPDLRFMGFSDLNNEITNPDNAGLFSADVQLTRNVINAILSKLEDPITEVQNQAMKW